MVIMWDVIAKIFDLHLKLEAKNTDFAESVLNLKNQINEVGYANTNDLLAYEKLLDKLGLVGFNHLHKN